MGNDPSKTPTPYFNITSKYSSKQIEKGKIISIYFLDFPKTVSVSEENPCFRYFWKMKPSKEPLPYSDLTIK